MTERIAAYRENQPEDPNKMTIDTYERHIQEYIDGTPHEVNGNIKAWIDQSLEGLQPNARILELGSGFGRDASYIQARGYDIECSDATKGFVELLTEQGFNARELNALTDDLNGPYDLVIANAVLLHFTHQQTADVLRKVHGGLGNDGKFAFTLKMGDGEGWSEEKLGAPRYFCYWQKEQVEDLLQGAGYMEYDVEEAGAGGNALWLHIVARK